MDDLLGQLFNTKTLKFAAILFIGIIVTFGVIIGVEYMNSDSEPESEDVTAFKPVIYLYPEIPTQIDVDLFIKGEILVSEPLYENGWNVMAYPNGTIESTEGKHDYLFYEARLDKIELPQEGWVVNYDSLESWMTETLDKLGLNENESGEFKEFWLDKLPFMPFYEIKVVTQEYLEDYMGLEISPAPDTIIRVHLHFKGISSYKSIVNPIISKPVRYGFTVVEWGGFLV